MKLVQGIKEKLDKIYKPILIFYALFAINIALFAGNISMLTKNNALSEALLNQIEQLQDEASSYENIRPAEDHPKDDVSNLSIVADNFEEDLINNYIERVCDTYPNVDKYIIRSVIQQESSYDPNAKNGNCIGLMQISTRWHVDRMQKLGVTDLYDPYGNILVGVDYISELSEKYKKPELVLMLYSMRHDDALKMYESGQISKYAVEVLERADQMRLNGE